MKIVLASGNAGKLAEFRALLPAGYEMVSQAEVGISPGPETGTTFVENALQKARHAAGPGLPVLADDSGICVDYLRGAPGLYSARYAGEQASDRDNNDKLLAQLEGVSAEARTAYFHCTLVFLRHPEDPAPVVCQANWYGRILAKPVGGGGFGYDPVFYVPDQNMSSAELAPEVKNRISHRGQAARKWADTLQAKG